MQYSFTSFSKRCTNSERKIINKFREGEICQQVKGYDFKIDGRIEEKIEALKKFQTEMNTKCKEGTYLDQINEDLKYLIAELGKLKSYPVGRAKGRYKALVENFAMQLKLPRE